MRNYLLLLLLVTFGLQAQTLPSPSYNNTTTNTLKIKNPATVTSVNFLSTVELDGSVAKVSPGNLGFASDANVVHKTGDTFVKSVGFPPILVQNESSSNIEKRYLSPEATRLSNAYITIVCWGDSLTQGAGSTGGLSYPTRLANATTYTVINKGVGGETSTQIKDRMIADTGNYDKTVIIWAGRNNAGDTTTVKSDIAAMVSALGHQRYLVMGILNGDYSSEWNTGVTYPKIIGLNNSLSKIYGKRYVPIREILISMHDGSAQDLIDVGRDIVPASLRSDNIHLNDKGYQIVEETNYQRLGIALGQEGYLQSKDFKGLFESYSPLHTYGNETVTGLKTFTNTANTADTGFIFNNSGTGLNANNIRSFVTSGGNLINADISAGGSIVYGNITGSSGFGVRLVNGGTGLRVDNYTTSSRAILLNIFNNSRGIDTQNGGTFASYYSNTTAGGSGFQAITPTGTGYLATVTGSAVGASFTSQSSSSLFRLDGLTGITGNLFEVRSLGSIVSYFNSIGKLTTPDPTFTGTAGFYIADINSGYIGFSTNTSGVGINRPAVFRQSDRLGLKGSITNNNAWLIDTNLLTAIRTVSAPDSDGTLAVTLNGSATLDFPSTASNTESNLTITVTGAVVGDVISLGAPAIAANTMYLAFVSAADTVTVRFRNLTLASIDPASATFKVKIFK